MTVCIMSNNSNTTIDNHMYDQRYVSNFDYYIKKSLKIVKG
jgi:hypothetical protein